MLPDSNVIIIHLYLRFFPLVLLLLVFICDGLVGLGGLLRVLSSLDSGGVGHEVLAKLLLDEVERLCRGRDLERGLVLDPPGHVVAEYLLGRLKWSGDISYGKGLQNETTSTF